MTQTSERAVSLAFVALIVALALVCPTVLAARGLLPGSDVQSLALVVLGGVFGYLSPPSSRPDGCLAGSSNGIASRKAP